MPTAPLRSATQYIRLQGNKIGNDGIGALAQAFVEGADCEDCDLSDNPGDAAPLIEVVGKKKKSAAPAKAGAPVWGQ